MKREGRGSRIVMVMVLCLVRFRFAFSHLRFLGGRVLIQVSLVADNITGGVAFEVETTGRRIWKD